MKLQYSNRFIRLAQLLFTSEISEQDQNLAQKIVDLLDKTETNLQNWVDSIKNNLDIFKNYHGKEKSLFIIADKFKDTQQKQKEKYERLINMIKESIELINEIRDVEMQDMITNLTKESEAFTEMYDNLTNLPVNIGEVGFVQQFKDVSQSLVDNNKSFFEVIQRIKDYILKNILGEQLLS